MAKKVNREALEAEELDQPIQEVAAPAETTALSAIEAFVTKFRMPLLIGAGALILVTIGVVGYRYWVSRQNETAEASMIEAVKYWELALDAGPGADSLFEKSLNGDGANLGFLEVADDYAGTDAANLANYYIGIAYLRQNKTEEGVSYLKKFSTGDNMLSTAAYIALGFAYEDLGDPAKAADYFEQAANTPGENEVTTPTLLMHAARNYEAADKKSKALALYETIKKKYPLTQEGVNVDKFIGRVSE
jgi:tetratricopeptide (TPR) repeat protein